MRTVTTSALPILSVVVPLFNEEGGVNELVTRVQSACRSIGVPYEIVAVNDGSKDATLSRLIGLTDSIPQLKVVDLWRNFGHMAAVSAGLANASGAAVVLMDGDLQDPPELIPELFARWQGDEADIVYALRTQRHEGKIQQLMTRLFYFLLGVMGEVRIPKQVGTFGLMDRRVVEMLSAMPERVRFFAGLRSFIGGREAFVPYERPARVAGESRVGAYGLVKLARTALISFSKVPLRYAAMFSLFTGLILFAVGSGAILVRLFTQLAIPGWATFTTMIGFMGFAQSLVLAALAEYVAVIFDEIKARPLFLVRRVYNGGTATVPGETTPRGVLPVENPVIASDDSP